MMQHPSLKQNAVTTRGNSTSPYSPQRKPEPFIGQDLFPSYESIIGDLSDQEILKIFKKEKSYFVNDVVWLRASQIFRGVFKVFEDKIEPNDILQGGLGDCYLLAALASLAEKPERIKDLFLTQEPNKEGLYQVLVCNRGIWQVVTVDDYFPCDRRTKKPIFAKSNRNELWVLLLEKAWAKIHGSYGRISGGLALECLRDFTGAPTMYYTTADFRNEEEIWMSILDGEEKNFVMTCSTLSKKDLKEQSLVPGHAYSLLAAYVVWDRKSRSCVRIVMLRNPWGKKEWDKAWSEKSKSWSTEQRKLFKVEDKEDGIFFMPFEELLKHFRMIQICKVYDHYYYSSLESTCDHKQQTIFHLPLREAGNYFITINQESKRKHPRRDNYKYSTVRIALIKRTDDYFELIKEVQATDREVCIDADLEIEDYFVFVRIDWNEERNKEFSISSYGVSEVDIQETDLESLKKAKTVDESLSPQSADSEIEFDENCSKNQFSDSFDSSSSSQDNSDSNSSYYNSNSNYNNRNYDSDSSEDNENADLDSDFLGV